MRIAIIAPPWLPVPPPAYGGTEAVLDNLARGLQAAGHDVLLYATGDSTCDVPRAWTYPAALGTNSISAVSELRHAIDAYDAATAWGAEVVHDHTIAGLPFSAEHPELPVITTNHGPFDDALSAVYARLAARVPVIAISHHQASTAGEVPIAAVIHHGLDVDRCVLGRGDGGYALFLGRMSPDKGVHTAITVAQRAGVPLQIAAKMREPTERAYFEDCIRPRLGHGIEYVGEVGGDAKTDLLRDASCLLNPIAWPEPFGMVMIEALAHGTPVVATPCGAAPEIVDHGVTGWLAADEDRLAAAVADAPTLDRAACRAAAARRFSTTRMAAEHLAVYERVVDEGQPRLLSASAAS